jgi:CRP-like cAMP-binding protein
MHVVPIAERAVLTTAGESFTHLIFPIDCIMSIVVWFADGSTTEVGTVGREGFVPVEILARQRIAQRSTICQVAGNAAIMHREVFFRAMDQGGEFSAFVHRNANARLFIAEQLTACNAKHDLIRRCARWLLMTRDRIGRNEFRLTHEFLAMMLGVRRAGVTQAAGHLQDAGAITYYRGHVTIIDEDRLITAACECYPLIRHMFEAALSRHITSGDGKAEPLRPAASP